MLGKCSDQTLECGPARLLTILNSNTVDLRLLEEMGVTPDRKTREKRPRFKAVGVMVLAGVRMQRLQKAWAGQKKIQASLVRKVESMRRQSRKCSGR